MESVWLNRGDIWRHSCISHNSFAQSQRLYELSFTWGCGNAEIRLGCCSRVPSVARIKPGQVSISPCCNLHLRPSFQHSPFSLWWQNLSWLSLGRCGLCMRLWAEVWCCLGTPEHQRLAIWPWGFYACLKQFPGVMRYRQTLLWYSRDHGNCLHSPHPALVSHLVLAVVWIMN